MDLLFDAALNMELGTTEQLIHGTAGVMKIGDIASDVFFVLAIDEYYVMASSDYYDDGPIYVSAIVFTVIGFLFDLIKLVVFLRDRRRKKKQEQEEKQSVNVPKEEQKREWKCWKRSNFVFEEFPQLVIAIAFAGLIDEDCTYSETGGCTEEQLEAYYKARNSAIVSVLFTTFSLSTTIYLWIKHRRKKADHAERDDFYPT